nr:hypothetical protein [Tanacetum cinerariifolium]GFC29558.1 hypothetical protein [Tanacetum cinerariifolium]
PRWENNPRKLGAAPDSVKCFYPFFLNFVKAGEKEPFKDAAEPTPPSPTPTTTSPPPQELPSTSHVATTPTPSLIAQPLSHPQQQQPPQPSHDATISMDLLNTLLETYTTRTRKVEALE